MILQPLPVYAVGDPSCECWAKPQHALQDIKASSGMHGRGGGCSVPKTVIPYANLYLWAGHLAHGVVDHLTLLQPWHHQDLVICSKRCRIEGFVLIIQRH